MVKYNLRGCPTSIMSGVIAIGVLAGCDSRASPPDLTLLPGRWECASGLGLDIYDLAHYQTTDGGDGHFLVTLEAEVTFASDGPLAGRSGTFRADGPRLALDAGSGLDACHRTAPLPSAPIPGH